MQEDKIHRCCPIEHPCPLHTNDYLASQNTDRALSVEGASRSALEEAIDGRKVSRRGVVSLLASAGLFVPAAASSAPSLGSYPVFDPKKIGKVHVLPSSAETVKVGAMDPAAPVVLEIDSGDVVHYPNTWINWANEAKYGMSFEEREPIRKRFPAGPYSLVGPVAVKGAQPGDVIECRMLRLKPIDWGWNSAPIGVGALPQDFSTPYLHYIRFDADRKSGDFAAGVKIPLAPIQGVIAVQPAGDKPVSGILSGRYGGNIVLRDLTEGSSIFLPVEVSGGRLWTGDSHAAQGDGVVDQTAIETAMEDLRIQYVLHKGLNLDGPLAETPTHWILLGFENNLEDALVTSLHRTIAWMSGATGLSKQDIYALSSISGSFRVTQYAHQLSTVYTSMPPKAIHSMMPKAIFDAEMVARISQSLRPET
jgi:acetamidase/formamidase